MNVRISMKWGDSDNDVVCCDEGGDDCGAVVVSGSIDCCCCSSLTRSRCCETVCGVVELFAARGVGNVVSKMGTGDAACSSFACVCNR